MTNTVDGLILLKDLRSLVPLHPQHIRKLSASGKFPKAHKVGGRTMFRRADVLRWIDENTGSDDEARS